MKKILITGGAGFVGSHLAHRLISSYDVTILDDLSFGNRKNLLRDGKEIGHLLVRDIRDAMLEDVFEGVDTVFHFAAIAPLALCQADPLRAFSVNVSGTANVLEQARRAGVQRLIFASTSAVYERSGGKSHKETTHTAPDLNYSLSKSHAEQICTAYAANYDMDILICRFFNVYGTHQNANRKSPPFTSYVASELAAGRRPILFNSSAETKRDYIHIRDVVDLLLLMMESKEKQSGSVFNVGTGKSYSVPELAQLMCQLSGTSLEPIYRDAHSIWDGYAELFKGKYPLRRERVEQETFKHSVASPERTIATFNWSPKVDIATGLRELMDQILQQND